MEEPLKTIRLSAKPQRAAMAVALLTAIITFLVYTPSLQSGFVNWDDPMYVYDNQYIRSIDMNFFKAIFTKAIAANWHPLTILSLALDYTVLGVNPQIYHFTNILLHALNTFLVFILTFRLSSGKFDPKGPGVLVAGSITAFLFGLHPLHVESVAWISERKDVLSTFFFLLSVLAYLKYCAGTSKKTYLASLLFFILALMSKPMAITLPLVLLVLDLYPLQRAADFKAFNRAVYEKTPFFAFSLLFAILTLWAQRQGGALGSFDFYPFHIRAANAVRATVFYLYKVAFPFNLAPLYPFPDNISLLSPEYLASFALALMMLVFCVLAFKRHRVFPAVMLYYVITLLPVSGVIQVGPQVAADRYTYLPLIGPFMLLGLGAGILFEAGKVKRVAMIAASVALLVFFAFLTVRQEAVWKDSLALWSQEIKNYPKVPLAYYNRGLAYKNSGDTAQAIFDYDKALSLNPKYIPPYINRGIAYGEIGRFDLAVENFNTAILIDPNYGRAYLNRGYVFLKTGDYRGAIKDLKAAERLGFDSGFTYYNLGLAHKKLGEDAVAGYYFKKAAALGFKGEK